MMRCKKCNQTTVRVISKRELTKLSKKHYAGPIAAASAVAGAAIAKEAGPTLMGGFIRAAKTATKGPKEILITGAAGLALFAAKKGVDYLIAKRQAGDKSYAYCSSCGHYEVMP
jgi:hypothetical protein